MKKKILDLMKAEFVKNISSAELELIGGDLQENRKRDAEGKETGDVERFVRIEVEVRKGNAYFRAKDYYVEEVINDGI